MINALWIVRFLSLLSLPIAAAGAAPAPATVPAGAEPTDTLERKCQALRVRWQDRFDAERMTVVVTPPFVVASDGARARLDRYVAHTIRAAADALHRDFFDRRPTEPVLILLFESAEPYKRLAKQWLGDTDVSPYGYFRRDGIMVMNVGTGTGTLVHELVHALIKPDFQDVPDWFNEGLGSLFEQCTLTGGSIRGLVNWRLPALQRTIRAGTLRPLSELIADDHFYADARVGVNYAQARYLLMYLQENQLLGRFYKRFRECVGEDPSGWRTLKEVIGPVEIDEFEKGWRAWVLGLRFE